MESVVAFPFSLAELPEEKEKVKKAADHCRQILNHVNQAVKESENKQVGDEQSEHQGLGRRELKGNKLFETPEDPVLVTFCCASRCFVAQAFLGEEESRAFGNVWRPALRCCCVSLTKVTISLRFLQHLEDYQRRLDLSYLKQSEDPMMDEFRVSDVKAISA